LAIDDLRAAFFRAESTALPGRESPTGMTHSASAGLHVKCENCGNIFRWIRRSYL